MIAIAVISVLALLPLAMLFDTEDTEGATSGSGTQMDPYTSYEETTLHLYSDDQSSYYHVGCTVSIGITMPESNKLLIVTSVTSGYGLSVNSNDGLEGTITKAGTIDVYLGLYSMVTQSVEPFATVSMIAITEASNTYTLSYNAIGGSGAPATQSYGPTSDTSHTFTIPSTTPSLSNYSFYGWTTTWKSAGTQPTGSDTIYHAGDTYTVNESDMDKTLYAIWRPTAYRLLYSANGGSGAPDGDIYPTSSWESHTFTISSTTPTRSGYAFQGWSTDRGATSPSYYPGGTITLNSTNVRQTLYAVWWKTYNYSFYYDANGGSGAPSTQTYGPTTDTSHTFTVSSTTPTRSNYIFLGWSSRSSATSATYTSGDTITLISDSPSATLYAVWQSTYTVTFTSGGNGTVSQSYLYNVPSGSAISVSANTVTINGTTVTATPDTGYYFDTWSNTSGTITADRTITANFTIHTFTVSFTAGTGGAVSQSSITDVPYGSSITVSANTVTINGTTVTATPDTGYEFFIWHYASGTVRGDRTINAEFYVPDPPMFFFGVNNSDYGSASAASYDESVGDWISFSSPGEFAVGTAIRIQATPISGCDFVNFTTSGESVVSTNATYEFTMPANDYALRANFTTNGYKYSLSYDANGGSGAPATETTGWVLSTSYNFTISDTIPTWTNHIFLGWSGDADHGTADVSDLLHAGDNFAVANTTTGTTSTVTLYAVWSTMSQTTFNLIYTFTGGSMSVGGTTYTNTYTVTDTGYVATMDFTVIANSPTKSPNTFLGWADSSSATVPTIFGGDTVTVRSNEGIGTVTIYAVWQSYDDDVTYWSNGEYNGSVSILYHLDNPSTQSYYANANAIIYRFIGSDSSGMFAPTQYHVTIEVASTPLGNSNYNAMVTATVYDPSEHIIASNTYEFGKWGSFIVTIDTNTSVVSVTKVSQFRTFTSYIKNDTTNILDYSGTYPYRYSAIKTMTFFYLGNSPRQQITDTSVFMNTYGVVMTDPSIDIDYYWPNMVNARFNIFSFALYGTSATFNGITFPVNDGRITITYANSSDGYVYDPNGGLSKTLTLQNIYLTWQGGHCYLTFNSDRFEVDLGAYTDRVVSFGGVWYFSSGIYDSYQATETVVTKDWWAFSFDFTAFALIMAALLTFAGIYMRLKTRAKTGDYLILIGAIALALIMAGGVLL